MPAHKGGKKNRKHGRNKAKCQAYFKNGRRAKNKLRKLAHHLKKHPEDRAAFHAANQLK